MTNSAWSAASWVLVAALALPGCSSSDEHLKSGGPTEGTDTGNGSCLGQWCLYPRVLTQADGGTYAGYMSIDGGFGAPHLSITGFRVIDDAAGCSLVPNDARQFEVWLRSDFATVDDSGQLRVRWSDSGSDGDFIDAADLTLTSERDLSGTLTGSSTPETVNDDYGLTRFKIQGQAAVQGQVFVACPAGESSISIPLADGNMFRLNCGSPAAPPGLLPCNDTL
jgi:hypothetical protein